MNSFAEHDFKKLSESLIKHEGLRLSAYKCTAGILTIGVGHNVIASPVEGVKKIGDKITYDKAMDLLYTDIHNAIKEVDRVFPWAKTLNAPRRAFLYEFSFNLGIGGVKKFNNTLDLIKSGDFIGAAKNLRVSLWAKQVKGRAVTMIKQLETGEWA